MMIALKFLAVLFLFAFSISAPLWFPILIELAFHPRERQRRRHKNFDWTYADVDLAHSSGNGDRKVELERRVKYNDDGEFFIRNRRPYCHGRRWEPDWLQIEDESLLKSIKEQI